MLSSTSLRRLLLAPVSTPEGGHPATDSALLCLRLTTGLAMASTHGRGTLAGFRADPSTYPDPLGLGPELSMGLMVFAELFCAAAVALGLLTRLATVPLILGLGTAFFVFHAGDPFGDRELAFLYLAAWCTLFLAGPGRLSLDRWWFADAGRRRTPGVALVATVAAGAAAALLAPRAVDASPATPATSQVRPAASPRLEGDLPRRDDRPLEQIADLETVYGHFPTLDPDGQEIRLRTVLTRPRGTTGRLPAILFVQWLSCDTVEVAAERTDGWAEMLRRVANASGAVMMRTDKAGIGDSEGGPCSELGYDLELEHHRRALAHLRQHPWVDAERVVVFGASMGATMAPLVATGLDEPDGQGVAGVVAWGGGAFTWLERTTGFERRRRQLSGLPGDRLDAEMRAISAFLPEYLMAGTAPEDESSEPIDAWDLLLGTERAADGTLLHYGRPLAFHREAQARNWSAAWEAVEAPVLVLYGEYDWFEAEASHRWIADVVNRRATEAGSPPTARLAVFPGLDHHFHRHSTPEAAMDQRGDPDPGPVVEEIVRFVRRVTDSADASPGLTPSAPRGGA